MADVLDQLKPNERRGSKVRCHLLTHGDDAEVAARLTALAAPWGLVRSSHCWLPRGFEDTMEARLGETPGLLSDELREKILRWWLEVLPKANTPNWDIASTCEIEGEVGLLLVEAKAHGNELSGAGKPEPRTRNGRRNHEKIGTAIREANTALGRITGGWALCRDSHYQLCNRFAWAWKLAWLGLPVILVYLGFLNADEMGDCGQPFGTAADWDRAVRTHSAGVVPDNIWEGEALKVGDSALRALIRSEQVALPGPETSNAGF